MPVLDRSQVELWSNDIYASTTSPILVGDRIYIVSEKGSLCSVDVNNGKILWRQPIGIEQRNSCPLWADGKIYVPILNDPGKGEGEAGGIGKGGFYIFKVENDKPTELSHVALAWTLSVAPNVLLIPGTSSVAHLEENLAVADIELPDDFNP